MNKIVIENSRRKLIAMLVVCIVLLSFFTFVLIVAWGDNWGIALSHGALAVFILLFAVYYGWQIVDFKPQLVVDENGFYIAKFKIGMIPWQDIEQAYIGSANGSYYICLHLKEEDKYLNKLWPIHKFLTLTNKKFGMEPISLATMTLKIDPQELCNLVNTINEKAETAREKFH